MATDSNSVPLLSGELPVAICREPPVTDDGAFGDSRQINSRAWTTALIIVDIACLVALWIPVTAIGNVFDRYSALQPGGKTLALGLLVSLYISVSRVTGIYDTAGMFDLRHSARRLVISAGLTLAIVLIAHKFPRHGDNYAAIKLCLHLTSALLALAFVRTAILYVIHCKICAGRMHIFQAINVGICCDPTPSSQIARLTGNHVRPTHNMRLENTRELGRLSTLIARDKIDRIYVSSVWSQAPTVARNLRELQESTCRLFVSVTNCPLDLRPAGELTVCASTTVIGIVFDRWNGWLKRLHDVGVATLVLLIASL